MSPYGGVVPKTSTVLGFLATLPLLQCLLQWTVKTPFKRLSSGMDLTTPETLVIHSQHFSLLTSLFGVPDFLNYVFLIYHNLKCFKSIAHSDTTTGNVSPWNIWAGSYSFPSDTRGSCNLGITELLKLMAEGQAIFFVTLYIMLWFSKRVAGLFWFFTHR